MDLHTIALLIPAGIAGGTISSLVGGAAVVTFPALIATGLSPVTGNLLHHAIEMYLKGALSKTKSLSELKQFWHNLPDIWAAFKVQANNNALDRFDGRKIVGPP